MTDMKQIEQWAAEAGCPLEPEQQEELAMFARFAALVAAHQREVDAKIAESTHEGGAWIGSSQSTWRNFKGERSAAAIRSQSKAE